MERSVENSNNSSPSLLEKLKFPNEKWSKHQRYYRDIALGVYKKYYQFEGRASREEYWTFALFVTFVAFFLHRFETGIFQTNSSKLEILFLLGSLVPFAAVTFRRLQDMGREGKWALLSFTIIGHFAVLYWLAQESLPLEAASSSNLTATQTEL
jgi:uncharacterized membrane protein YhaH (DUF805 family)